MPSKKTKSNFFTIILLILILLNSIFLGYLYFVSDQNFQTINSSLNSLHNQTTSLTNKTQTLDSSLSNLLENLNSTNTNLTLLENSLENKNKELDKKINSINISLSTELSNLYSSLNALEIKSSEDLSKLEEKLGGISNVAQTALNSTVRITAFSPKGTTTGSGAIILPNGYIVTNHHVVENATRFEVKLFDNRIKDAELIGSIISPDLAVLKIQGEYPFLKFQQDFSTVNVGQEVVALGSPVGLDFTVTKGILSSKLRTINGVNFIQIDSPLNPGNSGGPIVGVNGKILGIVTSKIAGQGVEGLGFAIHAQDVVSNIKIFIAGDGADITELEN